LHPVLKMHFSRGQVLGALVLLALLWLLILYRLLTTPA
jgi:hypothetical protein